MPKVSCRCYPCRPKTTDTCDQPRVCDCGSTSASASVQHSQQQPEGWRSVPIPSCLGIGGHTGGVPARTPTYTNAQRWEKPYMARSTGTAQHTVQIHTKHFFIFSIFSFFPFFHFFHFFIFIFFNFSFFFFFYFFPVFFFFSFVLIIPPPPPSLPSLLALSPPSPLLTPKTSLFPTQILILRHDSG